MKHKRIFAAMAVVALITMSCGLFGTVGNLIGGGKSGTVSNMWPDVPVMDGMNKTDLELPLPAKLAIQAFAKASSQGDGSLDFIGYTTSKSVRDVMDFYSLDKMQAAGWTLPDMPGCAGGTQDTSGGGICFFGKEEGSGKGALLAIFTSLDDKTKEVQVFFARVEISNIPTKTP
jgi:hypothetical protein